MKHLIAVLFILFAHFSAHAETIRQVIDSGWMELLAKSESVDHATVPNILRAFNRVKAQVNMPLVMIKVVSRGQLAVTAGNTVLIHANAETLADIDIEFIIAHEIGHIRKQHKERRIKLYEKYIQGEVTPEKASQANDQIGPEMRVLSWECEYEADREALKTLTALGRSKDDVINAFLAMNARSPDTATHPSTIKRVMNLKRED